LLTFKFIFNFLPVIFVQVIDNKMLSYGIFLMRRDL